MAPKNYVIPIPPNDGKMFPGRSAFLKRNQEHIQRSANSAALLRSINGKINTIIHNQTTNTNELPNRNSIEFCVNSVKKEPVEETEFYDSNTILNVNQINVMHKVKHVTNVPIKLERNDNTLIIPIPINKDQTLQKTVVKPKTIKNARKINRRINANTSNNKKSNYLKNVHTKKSKSIKELKPGCDGSFQNRRLKRCKTALKSNKPIQIRQINKKLREKTKIKKVPQINYYNLRHKTLKSSSKTSAATCKIPKIPTNTTKKMPNKRKIKCESNNNKNNNDKNYELIRKKAHERYLARKHAGKLKSINEMTPWEVQRQRYKWRLSASRYFAKNQIEKMIGDDHPSKENPNLIRHQAAIKKSGSSSLRNPEKFAIDNINSLTVAGGGHQQKPTTSTNTRQLNSHILGIAYQKMKQQEKELCKLRNEIERLKCTIQKLQQ